MRRETLARCRKIDKPENPLKAHEIAGVGGSLLNQAAWLEAEAVVRECLTIREKKRPDDWSR